MMEISARAKERFCKDCNIPIRLFREPYFMERLKLYDRFYGTLEKWETFTKGLKKYHCEQDYFEEYNRVKDAAITSVKESEAYQRFIAEDMNQYRVVHQNLPDKDIFKQSNDGGSFVSIDMKKANFSALRHYSEKMFRIPGGTADTWEEFMRQFTDNEHIIYSKYIRQVILGNCNPKRHITYEKYLMDQVLNRLTEACLPIKRVCFFSNDEIVIDLSNKVKAEQKEFVSYIDVCRKEMPVPLKVEWFQLHKIWGTDGYYREIQKENGETQIEFKCLDNYMLPFVIRHMLGDEVTDGDRVFYHEGLLAQFIEVPQIVDVMSP